MNTGDAPSLDSGSLPVTKAAPKMAKYYQVSKVDPLVKTVFRDI